MSTTYQKQPKKVGVQLDKRGQTLTDNLDGASALNIAFPCSLVSGEIKGTSEIA